MYTADSLLTGPAVGTAPTWADAIRPHNPTQADAIAGAYVTFGAQIGLNADLAIAQGCHESAWFTSRHWVEQFDPCGLGVTSDTTPGGTFASIEDGVKAHLEHLVCYTMTGDPPVMQQWGMLDPRHDFHDGMPRVSDLVRPERKWAVPGDGYVASIVSIANSIVGGHAVAEPTQTDIGYPVEIDYTTFTGPERALADIQWWVTHDTEGGEQGSESVLKGGTASVHAMIDRNGSLEYMVPITLTAWTPGNDAVAKLSINVEKVGFAATGYTEAQYQSEAAFYRWCVREGVTGIPATYIGKVDKDGGPLPDVPGMLGHQDVPNPNVPGAWGGVAGHTDPGPLWDWAHFIALCTGAAPPPGISPTYRKFDATGHGIDGGFRAYWETNGGLPIFGFPLTEEVQYGGRTSQFFQRAIFQRFPEFVGTPNEVQLVLLGAGAAKAAGYSGPGID